MSEVKQEWLQKDYYKILGVPAKAGEAEITKAFRELARKYHPDKNAGDAAAERFKEISAAYDVLGNDSKRKSYDEFRRLAASGMPFGASGPNGSHSFQFSAGGGLGDLLADFLGGRSPSGFSGSTPGSGNEYFGGSGRMNIPHKGSDVHSSVTVTFEEALEGVTLQVPAPPGSRRRAKLTVRVPPGVSDAQQIRLRGKGSPGSGGGSPGDMILKVKVRPHRFFGREGNDLTLKVPVSLSEAALGAKIRVPTYYGRPVNVRIPPGTQHGKVLRVRGRGLELSGAKGDLLVTVEVVVPSKLSAVQRSALEELASTSTGEKLREHLKA